MRRKLAFCFVVVAAFLFFRLYAGMDVILPDRVGDYYKSNFIKDTGATNAVTAIYLNYRVYDTLFETLTLVVSVIGIIHFSRYGGSNEK